MKMNAFCFLLFLACMCLSLAQGSYENCCLRYTDEVKKSIKRRVVSYRIQETDGACNIRAVVFRLRGRKSFCADPKQQWVKNLMQVKQEVNFN